MRVLIAYDGSPAAVAAIEVGARLLPSARATVAYLWTPPFASAPLRQRLWLVAKTPAEFVELLEREGAAEADRLVNTGVVQAESAGWSAEPMVRRSFGGDGYRFAGIAEEADADVQLVGTRGLAGPGAVLDSFTDLLVHHSTRPVLVVPYPLLAADRSRAETGPIVLGWDGSPGAEAAARAAGAVFPGRELIAVSVGADPVGESQTPTPSEVTKSITTPEPASVPGRGRAIARALIDNAHSHDAGVLVVGSRGRSALRELLLGSTAMAVLHHAHMPVLVVPQRPHAESQPGTETDPGSVSPGPATT
jgi:nucleotide-binding universal stress UspA family protein